MPHRTVITLTTDYGQTDHFVGVMKGVILNINPEVQIVDLNHQVNSYDIFDAAFTVGQSYTFFPPDTIHVVVVDPGVGSARRPILVRTGLHKFVAPDNGVLSIVFERERGAEVWHVNADHYFLNPVSNTFHGRDIFAPIAAWLSKGVAPERFGDPITDFAQLASPKPKRVDDSVIKGVALKVDKFGNLITNISPRDVPQLLTENPPPFKIVINDHEITRLSLSYSTGKPSEIFAIVGSSGYLEISTNRGSAAKVLNATRGTDVGIVIGNPATTKT